MGNIFLGNLLCLGDAIFSNFDDFMIDRVKLKINVMNNLAVNLNRALADQSARLAGRLGKLEHVHQ